MVHTFVNLYVSSNFLRILKHFFEAAKWRPPAAVRVGGGRVHEAAEGHGLRARHRRGERAVEARAPRQRRQRREQHARDRMAYVGTNLIHYKFEVVAPRGIHAEQRAEHPSID